MLNMSYLDFLEMPEYFYFSRGKAVEFLCRMCHVEIVLNSKKFEC